MFGPGAKIETLTGVSAAASCNVTVLGAEFNGTSNGIIRASGTAAVTLKSTGARLRGSAAWWVAPSGTPTLNPKSDEIQLDVSDTKVVKAQGNTCYNTNAAVGTLGVAGPVVADASVWRLRTDLTKTS
ncbi:hypothetical protein Ql52_gp050 [Caulobacter phage Quill_5.2]|uniref:Uncharacterized protein n=1 Tax=Caulobacter phage Quill_5.2 TaxID=3075108 RepID=A0AA96PY21_9CAUD|nr:hypothetical protein Ql52_gp050 [Caulobacter phage Quill_5.2]